MTKFDTSITTRVTYTIFMKSDSNKRQFLGITTEVYKGFQNVYYESHIEQADDKMDLRTIWTKWRDFLQQGESTKVSSGYCYGKYIVAVKEWEA